MLPKKHRLPSPSISLVFQKGRRVFIPGAEMRFIATKEPNARAAIKVSSRSIKKATERNRIKRLIHEAWRPVFLKISPIDMVVIIKTPLENIADAHKLLIELGKRATVL